MKNPFLYSETVSGDNFCNRKKEIKELSGRYQKRSEHHNIFSKEIWQDIFN